MNFLTPVDVTPATTGGWVDLDLSGYVPAGSTGVALRFINTGATDRRIGARNNDSTDATDYFVENSSQVHLYCGVDGSRLCEVYRGGAEITIKIDAYFGAEAVFFGNSTAVEAGLAATWSTVDISTAVSVGATAVVAVLNAQAESSGGHGFRPSGSTDDRHGLPYGKCGFLVGLTAHKFEGWRNSAVPSFQWGLMGYLKSGVTVVDPATEYSGSSTGVYSDLTALPSGALGGHFIFHSSTGVPRMTARMNGATHDDYYEMPGDHAAMVVRADASGIVEGKRSNTSGRFWLNAYFVSANHAPEGTGSLLFNGNAVTISRYLKMPHVYTNLIRLTTGSNVTWVTFTMSNITPLDAKGVILRFRNTGATSQIIGARARGSTDNDTHSIGAGGTVDLFAGIDGGQVEYYRESTSVQVYLAAVFGEEAHFFAVSPVLTPSTVDAWEAVNITTNLAVSTHTPIAAFVVNTLGGADPRGFRKTGSTDNRIGVHNGPVGYVVGLSNNQFDAYRGTATQKLMLKGYLHSGGTFPTNATEYSGSSTGVYADLTAFASGSTGALIEVYDVGGGTNTVALRANDSTDDYVDTLVTEQTQLVVALDASRIMEAKRSSPNTRFFSSGYFNLSFHQPTQGTFLFNGGVPSETIQENIEPYEGSFFFEGQILPIDKTMERGALYFYGEAMSGSMEQGRLYFYGGAVSVSRHGWSAVPSQSGMYRIS